MMEGFRQKALEGNAYDVAMKVAQESGIYEELRQDTSIEGISRLENAHALMDGIKEFVENDNADEATNDRSLAGLFGQYCPADRL
jgi:DNA helicase-2/ATP-dependent DNA helicase PcrA